MMKMELINDEECLVYSKSDVFELASNMQAQILEKIDKLFSEVGLQYFAFSNLLIYAEYYHDFFDSGKIENYKIGMVRNDFEKCKELLVKNAGFEDFVICTQKDDGGVRRIIQIGRKMEYYVIKDGGYEHNNKFWGIEICPFDYIPNCYEQQRFHFWIMRKMNMVYMYLGKGKGENFFGSLLKRINNRYVLGGILHEATKYLGKTNMLAQVTPRRSKVVGIEQLFPVKKCRFRNFSISVPNDVSVWCYIPNNEVISRTKSIQKVSLEILKRIDRTCKTLQIGYFLCGGSLLGAIRNGGFIPWDDDIDIGMLRKDYETFLEKGKAMLGEGVFLQTRQTDPEIPYLFSKVRANNTLYITSYNEYRHFHKGICVDIFPFDNIPDSPEEQVRFRKEVRKWEKLHNRVVNKQKPGDYFESGFSGIREGIIHFLNFVHRKAYGLIPLWFTQKLYLKHAQKHNTNCSKYVASFVPTYTYISREDLLPYKKIKFEEVETFVPRNPEVFLEMQYGDFMQLPPEHCRQGHDLIAWAVDTADLERGKK